MTLQAKVVSLAAHHAASENLFFRNAGSRQESGVSVESVVCCDVVRARNVLILKRFP